MTDPLDEVPAIRDALLAAQHGDFDRPETRALVGNFGSGTLEEKLQAITRERVDSLAETIENNNIQLSLTLAFGRHAAAFGADIAPNTAFWATERQADASLGEFLLDQGRQHLPQLQEICPTRTARP